MFRSVYTVFFSSRRLHTRCALGTGVQTCALPICFVNYNSPDIGVAAQKILAHNGVSLRVDYPGCCGMPRLEQGDLDDVAARAKTVAAFYAPLIDQGYDIKIGRAHV